MSGGRCRYTPNVRGDPDLGRVSCWRPTYPDSHRCVWHTEDRDRTPQEFPDSLRPGERLDGAALQGLDLRGTDLLAETVLLGADLTDANVTGADFSGADLREATLDNLNGRRADFSGANVEDASLADADLRSADLTMTKLDAADLTALRINGMTAFGERAPYEVEMERADDPERRKDRLEAAVRTYRKLEHLSQDNTLYGQASGYYRKSKDLRRRYNWATDRYAQALLGEASRWITGYGNHPWRVIVSSIALIVLAGLAFPLFGGLTQLRSGSNVTYVLQPPWETSLGYLVNVLLKSIYFSVVTFTTLGYGNLEPATTFGRYVAILEAFLGSILMALLVAVLTRSTWLR